MVKLKGSEDQSPMALKMLKKSEVIRLKQVSFTRHEIAMDKSSQVEHVKAEKNILSIIDHPYIVNL